MPDEEIILPLDFREDEVVPAQRVRFRSGARPQLGMFFALLAVALLAVGRVTNPSGKHGASAILVPALLMLVSFAGVVLAAWRFAPVIDFRTNQVWKRKHRLRITPEALFLESPDGGRGTELRWRWLRRVRETRRAFILTYRSEREFLIVPRRVLGAHEAEFRRLAAMSLRTGMRAGADTKAGGAVPPCPP
jgi:hypothetical protein